MGVGRLVFNIFKDFLFNCQQRVFVDGNFIQFKPVVSSVPLGSVLGPLFFILYTADTWNDLENKIFSYASPSEFKDVANSLNRDLAKIQSWYST